MHHILFHLVVVIIKTSWLHQQKETISFRQRPRQKDESFEQCTADLEIGFVVAISETMINDCIENIVEFDTLFPVFASMSMDDDYRSNQIVLMAKLYSGFFSLSFALRNFEVVFYDTRKWLFLLNTVVCC